MDERCCDPCESTAASDVTAALTAAGFGAVWDGRADRPDKLLPADSDAAVAAAESLASRGCCELDALGRLVGVHGLTLRPTRHRFVHAHRSRYTWCAYDAVGIPAALKIDATARTRCPQCDRQLEVDIINGEPQATSRVLWLPPAAASNLLAEFCAHADLYCSVGHLRAQIDTSTTPGRVVGLSEAAALGRASWAGVARMKLGGTSSRGGGS